ncbi:PQQ-dependent sugar dehydrogenase [Granulicella aggregans]|uniref:PQQ-dependent sugar dehydrogenase n=1 Tax=Granulicella aggregans TaxID=474949 RepID=UPI0021DFDC28|nr:PQQ-dependent sugar dehydrogenase [Granulicella aggregans]
MLKHLICCISATALAGTALAQTPPAKPPDPTRPGFTSFSSPKPDLIPGKPIDHRDPELKGDHPAFPGQTRAPYAPTTAPKVTLITDQLHSPWGLGFLPDGKMIVTEKEGKIRIVSQDGTLSAPITGVPEVLMRAQLGLLDIELDPKFASNHTIYFTFNEPEPNDTSAVVAARAKLDEDKLALTDVNVIFRAKPALPRDHAVNAGSRIAIDRQGNLFVSIGDRSQSPPWDYAQKLDNDLGKMIHITPEGKPAPNNPYLHTPGVLPEIWSRGHRTPQGLTINPATGELWEVEHGPRGGDEINKPEAGKNYGWPVITHGIDYPGDLIGAGITEQAGMEQPLYYWDPVIAPSGLLFYTGDKFPQWKNNLFVGGLRSEMLDRIVLDGTTVVSEEPLLLDQNSRIRDVRQGPEGFLYVLGDNGKLFRLTPQ